jgi:hypothetical protein
VPHIREALAAPGAAFHLTGIETPPNGELVIRLLPSGPPGPLYPARLRAAVLGVVGWLAEPSTFVPGTCCAWCWKAEVPSGHGPGLRALGRRA